VIPEPDNSAKQAICRNVTSLEDQINAGEEGHKQYTIGRQGNALIDERRKLAAEYPGRNRQVSVTDALAANQPKNAPTGRSIHPEVQKVSMRSNGPMEILGNGEVMVRLQHQCINRDSMAASLMGMGSGIPGKVWLRTT